MMRLRPPLRLRFLWQHTKNLADSPLQLVLQYHEAWVILPVSPLSLMIFSPMQLHEVVPQMRQNVYTSYRLLLFPLYILVVGVARIAYCFISA